MTLDNLVTIVIVAVIVQIIWIIWFTTAIAEMRQCLRELRHNSNAMAFKIERLDSSTFAVLNRAMASTHRGPMPATLCAGCGKGRYTKPARPVAYFRRHGVPAHLCLDCVGRAYRDAGRPWDHDREEAAVAELTAEASANERTP